MFQYLNFEIPHECWDVPEDTFEMDHCHDKNIIMFNLTILLLLVTFNSGVDSKTISTYNVGNYIIGGVRAEQGEFPYQVALTSLSGSNLKYHCGGTIIDRYHVLTAGHCLFDYKRNPSSVIAIAGTVILTSYGAEDLFRGTKIIIHGNYVDKIPTINDIALLKVDRDFAENGFLRPASLPTKDVEISEECYATGWGYTSNTNRKVSEYLMKVDLSIFHLKRCEFIYREEGFHLDPFGQFCAGWIGGKSTCNGDSGGPLICDGILSGISIYGPTNCGRQGYPTVFTNVFKYLDWIHKNVD